MFYLHPSDKKKIIYKNIFLGTFLLIGSNTAYATCTILSGGAENSADGSSYLQNANINCTSDTILTPVIGNSSYAWGNINVAKETSEIIRWSNLGDGSGYTLKISVDEGATVTGESLDKGALLIHSGHYTKLGQGVEVQNSSITPENPITATIINKGEVHYLNPNNIKNNNKNLSAAISLEANDGPLNQIINNSGIVTSQSAWGILSTNLAVVDNDTDPNNWTQRLNTIDEYKFSYGNLVQIVNSNQIRQERGEGEAGSLYAGQSAALAVYQAAARQVAIINTNSGRIQGEHSGVSLVIGNTKEPSVLDNAGDILGGQRGISINKTGFSEAIGYEPHFGTIHNQTTGLIEGVQDAGVFNEGTLNVINNYGTISGGNASINSENGTIETAINNYGQLKGNVLLGNNALNLVASDQANTLSPIVEGDILGEQHSTIRITQNGEPTLFTSSGNATVGAIHIDQGTQLNLGNATSWQATTSPITNQGTVGLAATASIASLSGLFTNQGLISLGCANCINQSLSVNGNYEGSGAAALSLHTKLAADDSPTDTFIVNGQASGTTFVQVNNQGGSGGQTKQGIEVIKTTSSDAQAFRQSGRIVAGAYDYLLQKGDQLGGNAESWYLVSHLTTPTPEPSPEPTPPTPSIPIYRPEIGSYLANIEAANTMFAMRLTERMGEARYADKDSTALSGLWVRAVGSQNKFHENSENLKTKTTQYVLQLGSDLHKSKTGNTGDLRFGVMAGYGHANSKTHSTITGHKSTGKLDGYSLGVYGTWFENGVEQSGSYIDSWLLANRFKAKVAGQGLNTEHYTEKGWSASLEGGYNIKVAESEQHRYWLTPQAQVVWSNIKFKDFVDSNGTSIKNENSHTVLTRLGLRGTVQSSLQDGTMMLNSFAEANWLHRSKNNSVSLNDEKMHQTGGKNVGELKLGMELEASANSAAWMSVAKQWGSHKYSNLTVNLGYQFRF